MCCIVVYMIVVMEPLFEHRDCDRWLAEAVDRLQRQAGIEPLRWGMVLRIVPRPPVQYVHPDGSPDTSATPPADQPWHDAYWSIPAVCTHPGRVLDTCPDRFIDPPIDPAAEGADQPEPVTDPDGPHLGWYNIGYVGALPHPPAWPDEEKRRRLHQAHDEELRRQDPGPVTDADLDAAEEHQPDTVRLLGGRDGLRAHLEANRRILPRSIRLTDTSRQVWDYDSAARQVIALYRSLTPPTIDAAARVRVAGARRLRARQEMAGADQSAAALIRNAHAANQTAGTKTAGTQSDWAAWTDASRVTVDKWLAAAPLDAPTS